MKGEHRNFQEHEPEYRVYSMYQFGGARAHWCRGRVVSGSLVPIPSGVNTGTRHYMVWETLCEVSNREVV